MITDWPHPSESLNSSYKSNKNYVSLGSPKSKRVYSSYMSIVEEFNQSLNNLNDAKESFKNDILKYSKNISISYIMDMLIPLLAWTNPGYSSSISSASLSLIRERSHPSHQSNLPLMSATLPTYNNEASLGSPKSKRVYS